MPKKEFTDTDYEMFVMPFGQHKNKGFDDIPAGYLLWLAEEKNCPEIIAAYVDLNADDLYERKAEEESSFQDNAGFCPDIEDTF